MKKTNYRITYLFISVIFFGLANGENSYIRIGDKDGFGFGTGLCCAGGDLQYPYLGASNPRQKYDNGQKFQRSDGNSAANIGNQDTLEAGDYLPDLGKTDNLCGIWGDGSCNNLFDLRSANERNNVYDISDFQGVKSIDANMNGSQYTDLSIAWNWNSTDPFNRPVYGLGHDTTNSTCPTPSGTVLCSGNPDPKPDWIIDFVFDFTICSECAETNDTVNISIVYSDFDFTKSKIRLVGRNTTWQENIPLTSDGGPTDGLIKEKSYNLSFNEVFAKEGTRWRGKIKLNISPEGDKYYAIDYVELTWTTPPKIKDKFNIMKIR